MRSAGLFALIALLASPFAAADAPNCQGYNGQGYCQYVGRVTQLYVNSGGEILSMQVQMWGTYAGYMKPD